jgi:hypothetical protein
MVIVINLQFSSLPFPASLQCQNGLSFLHRHSSIAVIVAAFIIPCRLMPPATNFSTWHALLFPLHNLLHKVPTASPFVLPTLTLHKDLPPHCCFPPLASSLLLTSSALFFPPSAYLVLHVTKLCLFNSLCNGNDSSSRYFIVLLSLGSSSRYFLCFDSAVALATRSTSFYPCSCSTTSAVTK